MTTNGEARDVDVATGPSGPATEPQGQAALTREEWLIEQAKRVEELGVRVSSLINATADTFEAFVIASQQFFYLAAQRPTETDTAKETNDHQPTDSATEASA